LQVHRIIHDQHHGPTDTWNLAGLCPADHRLHHQGELGITGNADDPDGLTFTDAAGKVIDPATRPCKPTGPPPGGPDKPYEHPLGERLQRRAILYPRPTRRLTAGSNPPSAGNVHAHSGQPPPSSVAASRSGASARSWSYALATQL
jgi:hypothetical protein